MTATFCFNFSSHFFHAAMHPLTCGIVSSKSHYFCFAFRRLFYSFVNELLPFGSAGRSYSGTSVTCYKLAPTYVFYSCLRSTPMSRLPYLMFPSNGAY